MWLLKKQTKGFGNPAWLHYRGGGTFSAGESSASAVPDWQLGCTRSLSVSPGKWIPHLMTNSLLGFVLRQVQAQITHLPTLNCSSASGRAGAHLLHLEHGISMRPHQPSSISWEQKLELNLSELAESRRNWKGNWYRSILAQLHLDF